MQRQRELKLRSPCSTDSRCSHLYATSIRISLGVPYCSQSSPYSVCKVLVCIKRREGNMGVQVFDYIVNAVKRTGPSMEMVDDEDMATREDFSSWEWLVLNICEVC